MEKRRSRHERYGAERRVATAGQALRLLPDEHLGDGADSPAMRGQQGGRPVRLRRRSPTDPPMAICETGGGLSVETCIRRRAGIFVDGGARSVLQLAGAGVEGLTGVVCLGIEPNLAPVDSAAPAAVLE
jgi:hypothetical protein